MTDILERAPMSSADQNDLPDSDFAYIEPGGKKDGSGKTVPRSLRHYPIHDAAHVRNALARAAAAIAAGGEQAEIAKKAMPKIKAAANKMGIGDDNKAADDDLEQRADDGKVNCPTCGGDGKIMAGHRDCPPPPDGCGGSGKVTPEMAAKMKADKKAAAAPAKTGRARLYSEEFRSEMRTATEVRCVREMDPDSRTAQKFEMREIDNGSGGTSLRFTGYASVVEKPYEVSDMFGPYQETISRNAFNKTLKDGADVNFLCNHGGITMARTKSGTLRLASDSTGLYTEATLNLSRPDVQIVRAAVEDGDLDEMSFAFRATKQEWDEDYTQRMIQEVNLHQGDVSVVNFGANPATAGTVALRSRFEVMGISAEDYLAALTELRAGASISAANMKTLQTVLDLVQGADTNVDHALVELSHLIGVKNPDIAQDAAMDKDDPSKNSPPTTTDGNGDGEADAPASSTRSIVVLPDYTDEQRARLAAIRAGKKVAPV